MRAYLGHAGIMAATWCEVWMDSYEVTGESLLSELVTALVRHLRPGATVHRASGGWQRDSVRVRCGSSGRWIAVTQPETGPSGLVELFRQGAVGIVELGASSEEFERALNALDGRQPPHVSVSVLKLITSGARSNEATSVRLTARQQEVARLAASGHSNKEIAEALSISTNTVRTHLHSLSVKLEVESRMRMVAKARALGLLPSREDDRTAERTSA